MTVGAPHSPDAPPPGPGVQGGRVRQVRWGRLAAAAVAVVLGLVTISRPTTSLGVLAVLVGLGLLCLGVLTLLGDGHGTPPGVRIALATG